MCILFSLLVFIHFSFLCIAQDFESALIPMQNGDMFAFTNDQKSFTLELIAEEIQPLEQKNFVLVDGWIFQAFTLGFKNPNHLDMSKEKNQKTSLSQYVMYEVDYFKKELGYNCDSLTFKWGQTNDKYCYFWHYNTPKEMETLQKQMYLTTICHDQFLNMSIPLEKGKDFKDAERFLFSVVNTLKLYDKPLDFEKLNKELNKQ